MPYAHYIEVNLTVISVTSLPQQGRRHFQNFLVVKIVSEYDQEIPQSQTADNPVVPRGRAAQPSQDTRKTSEVKQPALFFPIKMIAILERTKSNIQQNIEQLQTPTIGVTINKKSTTTEPLP